MNTLKFLVGSTGQLAASNSEILSAASTSGLVKSTNYPADYPSRANESWAVSWNAAGDYTSMEITFIKFQVRFAASLHLIRIHFSARIIWKKNSLNNFGEMLNILACIIFR